MIASDPNNRHPSAPAAVQHRRRVAGAPELPSIEPVVASVERQPVRQQHGNRSWPVRFVIRTEYWVHMPFVIIGLILYFGHTFGYVAGFLRRLVQGLVSAQERERRLGNCANCLHRVDHKVHFAHRIVLWIFWRGWLQSLPFCAMGSCGGKDDCPKWFGASVKGRAMMKQQAKFCRLDLWEKNDGN